MILEAICNGSFYPFEDVNPRDPEYLDAHHKMCDILEILSHKLSSEDYTLVQSLLSTSSNAQCIECEAYFKLGFSAGLALQQEAQTQLRYLQEE